jgi:Protein kinase domain
MVFFPQQDFFTNLALDVVLVHSSDKFDGDDGSDDGRDVEVLLADWDLATEWSSDVLQNKYCGSPHYCAPQIFKGTPYVGPELDAWSAGVVLYTMVAGEFPFVGVDALDIAYRVQRGQYPVPQRVADDVVDLIDALLTVDPGERMTLKDARRHPWVLRLLRECCPAAASTSAPSLSSSMSLSSSPASPKPPMPLTLVSDAATAAPPSPIKSRMPAAAAGRRASSPDILAAVPKKPASARALFCEVVESGDAAGSRRRRGSSSSAAVDATDDTTDNDDDSDDDDDDDDSGTADVQFAFDDGDDNIIGRLEPARLTTSADYGIGDRSGRRRHRTVFASPISRRVPHTVHRRPQQVPATATAGRDKESSLGLSQRRSSIYGTRDAAAAAAAANNENDNNRNDSGGDDDEGPAPAGSFRTRSQSIADVANLYNRSERQRTLAATATPPRRAPIAAASSAASSASPSASTARRRRRGSSTTVSTSLQRQRRRRQRSRTHSANSKPQY